MLLRRLSKLLQPFKAAINSNVLIMKTSHYRSFSNQVNPGSLCSIKRTEVEVPPAGVSDFYTLRDLDYAFVDKTLLIKQIFEKIRGSPLLITRPRRWGKSLNLSMIQAYCDILTAETFDNTFQGTEIFQDKDFRAKHANKHPVILINFNNFHLSSSTKTPWPASEFQRVLIDSIGLYSADIQDSDRLSQLDKDTFFNLLTTVESSTILDGLRTVMRTLKKHYQKRCIILIDEYDTPYNTIAQKDDFTSRMEEFKDAYKVFLTSAFKDLRFSALQFAVMTGVSRISHDQLLSGLNNLTCDMVYGQKVLDSKFFGFNETEVRDIIQKTMQSSPEKLDEVMNDVRSYYNGYRRMSDKETFYNPWSIAQFCISREFRPYWKASATDTWLKESYKILSLFEKAELDFLMYEQDFEVLKPLNDKIHIENLSTDPSMFWSLLIHTGYLTFGEKQPPRDFGNLYSLKVPNRDAFEALKDVISRFENLLSSDFIRAVKISIQDDDLDRLFKTLNEWIAKGLDTGYTYADESSYHMFLYQTFRLCLIKENWNVYSERILEEHKNRFDIVLASEDRLYLFELKFLSQTSAQQPSVKIEEALQQIDEKEYSKYFKGLSFKKKTKIGVVGQGKTLNYKSKESV